jgi:EmrB/QacA subfamily drug resistance transporter
MPVANDVIDAEKVTLREGSLALAAVCLGLMMTTFNNTIANVALPSIGSDLHLSDTQLVQLLSAYVATFGGFLLLAGRLGDAFGHRRMFVLGVVLFAIASLSCGVATSPSAVIISRSVQGVGAAIISAIALSLAVSLFERQADRARALGLCAFVSATGGSVGLLLGGLLVSALDWRWAFILNVPIGVMCAVGLALQPRGRPTIRRRLELRGTAVAIALPVAVMFVIRHGNEVGWTSWWWLPAIASAGLLLVMSMWGVSSVRAPVVHHNLARIRRLTVLNVVAVLLSVAQLTWTFASTLYLQRVLAFSPLQVGLAFLPGAIATAVMSLSIAPWLIVRFGVRRPVVLGLLGVGAGLTLLGRMASDANVLQDILPGMLLVGLGIGASYTPLLHAAFQKAAPDRVGSASGLISTSFMVGGALGLSALGSIAAGRTEDLVAAGVTGIVALSEGYRVAFEIGAAVAYAAAFIGAAALRDIAGIEMKQT